MKKITAVFLCALILSCALAQAPTRVFAAAPELATYSYVLIEQSTRNVLCEKNARERMYPASLTKIMTMLLVMEEIDSGRLTLKTPVTITQEAAALEGTRMFLEAGEIRTVEELMYGTAVESGNDAATALAIHIGGSVSAFAMLMNQKAAALGLNDTNFVNASGLHEAEHYTTAYDTAIISAELLNHEGIYQFISTWMIDVYVGKNNDVLRTLASSNKLLRQTDYVDGIKTGFTEEAGHCISVSGKKGETRLIGVLLRCGTSANRVLDSEALLSYGFSNWELIKPVTRGEKLETILVQNGTSSEVGLCCNEDYNLLVEKAAAPKITTEVTLMHQYLCAPVASGTHVGTLKVLRDQAVVAELPIYTAEAVGKCSLREFIRRVMSVVLI